MTEHVPTKRLEMTLEDRLHQEESWVYMTGMQALVRLPIQQRKRDIAAGLNTGDKRRAELMAAIENKSLSAA